ncbi:hypothetical protein OSB04_026372 [Centaurea solstitialis]|uniref:Uncharacterized protein n=1 Tax=Centaurea solstitialis TaxID=347529 RepID=A0AA38SPZ8_9ASTR|nr:hypothetical protein OSB04_026372 [Centaurea solstitialis]
MIIGNHLCEREVGSLQRELTGAQFLKAFTEPGSVHDHNEHDYEDMNLLGRVLCEMCKLSTQMTNQFKDIESTDNLEEIYMEQPKGLVAQGKENKINI